MWVLFQSTILVLQHVVFYLATINFSIWLERERQVAKILANMCLLGISNFVYFGT